MRVVLGITGGIAVYKVCELVRLLKKNGHEVFVMMTKNACEFVTPLTFQTLSQQPVATDLYQNELNVDIEHITLARRADIFVIAPATANIIGKLCAGIADDLLTTCLLATTAPVLICPAMNTKMYENKMVARNIQELKEFGYAFQEPEEGFLACNESGRGKLASPERILAHIEALADTQHAQPSASIAMEAGIQNLMEASSGSASLEALVSEKGQSLKGKKILITAGPTREPIDPVRFISNRSSGKMGYAIAKSARDRGAQVILISGPVSLKPPENVEFIQVEMASEMAHYAQTHFKQCDMGIMVAAVSDYAPTEQQKQKEAKKSMLTIELQKTQDIAALLGKEKENRFLVGFAAQTNNLMHYAKEKLFEKNLDLIVANDVSRQDIGFEVDDNAVVILNRDLEKYSFSKMPKEELAEHILDVIMETVNERSGK